MGLKKLTDRIYFLPHEPERDRPMLAYVKGDKLSLAVDAGYSSSHVKDFYGALEAHDLGKPNFTVITHWHYDHTFGLHAVKGASIAHQKTNLFLKEQRNKARDKRYIALLKQDDIYFEREYAGQNQLNITVSDIEYANELTLNLGAVTARVFHTVSPHSEDTTCIHIPEENVLFLGDAASGDFFNGGFMDKIKLNRLIQVISSIDCEYCALSHCEPMRKRDLLAYLDGIK